MSVALSPNNQDPDSPPPPTPQSLPVLPLLLLLSSSHPLKRDKKPSETSIILPKKRATLPVGSPHSLVLA